MPLKLWNSFLPSFMCCAFKTCHVTQSVGLLFSCSAEMISRGLGHCLSPDEAPKHESFNELMTEHYIRWKPMGLMSIKRKVCLQFITKKKKIKFAGKKMFKIVYASRNRPPHPLHNLGFSMPSHYSDWKYSSLHILLSTAWLHIETLRSQSFGQMFLLQLLF